MRVSTETIYRTLYTDPKWNRAFGPFLRQGRKRRQKRGLVHKRRGPIAHRVFLEQRPTEVDALTTYGHWEGDTLVGKHQQGEIGTPQHVYYRLNDRISVPTEMLSWAGKSTVMWFIGSHTIDTVRWLLGDEVRRVYAVSQTGILQARGIDTPDYYQATLEFRSGATAMIENSWILPNTTPNLVDVKCELVGSKGAIYVDASHNRALEKYAEDVSGYPDILVMPTIYGQQQGFAAESIRHFIDCVRCNRQPIVTGRDGLEVTKVICAIEESVRTRQPVEVRSRRVPRVACRV
jgi:predicted dehydrogenase